MTAGETAPFAPPAAVDATSSATPTTAAGGLSVLRLLALLESSPRFRVAAPPARHRELRNAAEDQARRGLPAWLWTLLCERVRECDPSEAQVQHAARFLDAGGWGFAQTITPQHLAKNPGLHDLLAQADAWREGAPARASPPRRENPFARISREIEEEEDAETIEVEVE